MAIMLNFHPQYKELVLQGSKTTTIRLGDRTDKYIIGEKVILSIGEKWCLTKIAEGIIEKAYSKTLGELNQQDLEGESEDSRTLAGVRETLKKYYRHAVEDEEMITVVKFRILPS